ncbi:NADH-quinone oxidoreductase subunit L [Reichenbachiella carrageenanivorans]|uniref:NADH-quinone oxidoreductase subunit L n=1 Tax=Reichenbachiella carrageenanivorans TaxID=2979869 RepID=A0ABY6D046_9BACT|nr:NADH-quinone oxidoreductase subunit L [Reichenbachiella carrageenanivorans]UXX79546.1 NADH-quinone oxidoreductase subunit L [Reichenbachiella carrageenanivorans]
MGNSWLYIILFAPLLSALVSYFLLKKWAGQVLVVFSALVLVAAVVAWFQLPAGAGVDWNWMDLGLHTLQVGLYYDALSGVMAIVVAIVALLVALFSIEYMKHDDAQPRYFALLGLFAFSMYGIVLSSNLLLTFIFWELVGFSSYMLIGFWFEKAAPPISSFKAFLMNKVGDVGFLLGIFVLYAFFKTLNIQELIGYDPVNSGMPTGFLIAMGIGLFLAAVGKSAQFPLQTWLPDAMTGPTPVSALIHAATMVAAGVYLMVRVFPLLAPEVLTVIGVIGGITAFMGAFAAFAQNDIKKILAFSTVSQLGYMIMAIGAGFPVAAFIHLTTHAFFKAGLFLCSGSIIHYYHETRHETGFDPQDIRNMGGLKSVLPMTFLVFTLCLLSLAGLPMFSGFLSKEMILNGLTAASHLPAFVMVFGFASVFMTAAYMARLYFKVFFNSDTTTSEPYAEAVVVKVPLLILALLSIGFVFSANPFDPSSSWLVSALSTFSSGQVAGHSIVVPVLSVGLALAGLGFSYLYIEKRMFGGLVAGTKTLTYKLSNQNFFIDAFYDLAIVKGSKTLAQAAYWWDQKVVDRVVNLVAELQVVLAYLLAWFDRSIVDGCVKLATWLANFAGERTRHMQGGNVQNYLAWAVFGVLLIFYFFELMT